MTDGNPQAAVADAGGGPGQPVCGSAGSEVGTAGAKVKARHSEAGVGLGQIPGVSMPHSPWRKRAEGPVWSRFLRPGTECSGPERRRSFRELP